MKNNQELIQKLSVCKAACEFCSDACLNETDKLEMLVDCIRLDRDCAEACSMAINFISRNSKYAADIVGLCEKLCRDCAEECEKHETEHCRVCAKACRECERVCQMEFA